MPQFDLRGIKVAKYVNNNGAVSYSDKTSAGDAMAVDLNIKHAEGRLYAEGNLAEYMKQATGGTASIGVKYLPSAVQKMMYGMRDKTRSIPSGTSGGASKTITSLQLGGNDAASYVGFAFYCPDRIDGVEKYTCVFVPRALFGPPAMSYRTKGENIQFSTPTTTGEFLPDHTTDKNLIEVAICDTVSDASAWIDLVLAAASGGST